MEFVKTLWRTFDTAPSSIVRTAATQATLTVVSAALAKDHPAPEWLLHAVTTVIPADRLLPRDVERYLRTNQRKPTRPKVERAKTATPGVRTVQAAENIRHHFEAEFVKFHGTQHGVYCISRNSKSDGTLFVTRADWTSPSQYLNKLDAATIDELGFYTPNVSAVDETIQRIYFRRWGDQLAAIQLPGSRLPKMVIESPAWLLSSVIGMAACDGLLWTVSSTLRVTSYDRAGIPVSHLNLKPMSGWTLPPAAPACFPIHAREDGVFVGLGPELVWVKSSSEFRTQCFDQEIRSISGSTPHTRARIAVFFDRGGTVLWPNTEYFSGESLPAELESPKGIFLRDGQLVIHASGRWCVYGTSNGKLEHRAELRGLPTDFVDFVPAHGPDRIALCFRDGRIQVYNIAGK